MPTTWMKLEQELDHQPSTSFRIRYTALDWTQNQELEHQAIICLVMICMNPPRCKNKIRTRSYVIQVLAYRPHIRLRQALMSLHPLLTAPCMTRPISLTTVTNKKSLQCTHMTHLSGNRHSQKRCLHRRKGRKATPVSVSSQRPV